jgi:diguanylate cyclase (GGDEF)-like protein
VVVLGVLVLALAAVGIAGFGDGDSALQRWAVPLAATLAATAVALRVTTVEHERRAWTPLAVGLAACALGSLLWAAFRGHAGDARPSPSHALWLAFYPAAYLTISSLLRRSFVRAPANMWLDGLLAAMTFSAVGVALIHGPLFHQGNGPTAALAMQVTYALGDVLLLALIIGVVAMSGWRPGRRWPLIGAALLCWLAADVINLNDIARGETAVPAIALAGWTLGFGLLALAPWHRADEPEGLRVEGLRTLLAPSVCSAIALGMLALDQAVATNTVTVVLALGAVAFALARTTLTLREVQLLADARHESLIDELTGLPGRRHFYRRLDGALRQAEAESVPLGLLIFDLDRFKELNDTLGHGAGDTLLQLVGRRLREALGRSTLLARTGGDEFAVLLAPGQGTDGALRAARKVEEAISRPFAVEGLELDIGVSIGVAIYPEHATEESELLRRADVAMYLAKEAGGGVALYDPARDLHTRDRLTLGRELRAGLQRGELTLFFQPKVDPQLGRVLGLEAVVRWRHPVHGLLAAPDFLPVASRSGLMPQVTRAVLDAALGHLARWRADGLELTVAVNLAVSDLVDAELPAEVARLLADHGLPADALELEVTEDGVISDPGPASATINALAELGVRIAVDDFGTGWSSLRHLRRLPFHELKIDRSFIADMLTDDDSAAIVRTTLDLARSLRVGVVAEGVEDAETWAALAELGCDAIQGFVLSRPLTAAQIEVWLSARREGAIARCPLPGESPPAVASTPGRFRL